MIMALWGNGIITIDKKEGYIEMVEIGPEICQIVIDIKDVDKEDLKNIYEQFKQDSKGLGINAEEVRIWEKRKPADKRCMQN